MWCMPILCSPSVLYGLLSPVLTGREGLLVRFEERLKAQVLLNSSPSSSPFVVNTIVFTIFIYNTVHIALRKGHGADFFVLF